MEADLSGAISKRDPIKEKFYISYLTVANFAYIARKLPKDITKL